MNNPIVDLIIIFAAFTFSILTVMVFVGLL
jgi:hypothetical protein